MNFWKKSTVWLEGLWYALRSEQSIALQICVIVVSLVGIELFISEWWLIKQTLLLGGGVLALEVVNTALEELCDLVEPNQNIVIKRVKDLASGAVGVFASVSILVTILDVWRVLS